MKKAYVYIIIAAILALILVFGFARKNSDDSDSSDNAAGDGADTTDATDDSNTNNGNSANGPTTEDFNELSSLGSEMTAYENSMGGLNENPDL